jgi:acetylornithine aminotransferase/acetylornithine/N-succinyldiaminopimelate aminotransferase
VLDAMAEGLLLNCTHDTVPRFLPPYIPAEKDVDAAVKILGKVFGKVKPSPGGSPKWNDMRQYR